MIGKPFDITKAVDFNDAQIADTWVDLPGADGFGHLVDPRSAMPLILLGGKGSGRTHLMRYYSYPVQKIRAAGGDVVEFLRKEGYLGIYMRCEGLNAGRFEGKGQTAETWAAVFAYYMDLWLAELVLLVIEDAFRDRPELRESEQAIAAAIRSLFDDPSGLDELTLPGIIRGCVSLRREVDLAVNNAALQRSLGTLTLKSSRGRLVFGVPDILATHLPLLRRVQCDYLIDELENLNEVQQEYVNTLIREKKPPCTFMVGARLYGLRTRRTLSAGEENRNGSEYEQVLLDDQLRIDPRYDEFARTLVAKRLTQAGYPRETGLSGLSREVLERLFETYPTSPFEEEQTAFVRENYGDAKPRPWLAKVRKQLLSSDRPDTGGRFDAPAVDRIVGCMTCDAYPLLEKANLLLLYQDWYAGKELEQAAEEIKQACDALMRGASSDRHEHVLGHFKGDLLAQLLREAKQRQRYVGLQSFIDMSSGLPRHLLIVLKHVHRWAVFRGEEPFEVRPVSLFAQRAGVIQASNWFFDDARSAGGAGEDVHQGVERLAQLFRKMRFSDKPVESSLAAFSFNEATASEKAKAVIRQAHHASMLLRVASGAKDRNDEGVVAKYQLNPMLSPRYDLPLGRRGTVGLSDAEVDAVFGETVTRFDDVVDDRLARMNAPFGRSSKASGGGRLFAAMDE